MPPEISDADLGGPPRTRRVWTKRQKVWLGTLIGLLVGVPLLLTTLSALTSPPHVQGVPTGHLVYLEADSPSEKTTTLRGLYVAGPDGGTRLLVHETEPQDIDGGEREWITQPALSPDGTRVAFEKQRITLQEDKQTIKNEIWVMPLAAPAPSDGNAQKPHLVIDLTKKQQKQVVGLAWDSDSSLLLLEDEVAYSVPTDTADAPLTTPLDLNGLTLATAPDVSATRSPALTEIGGFAYSVQTPTGPQVLIRGAERRHAGADRRPCLPCPRPATKSPSCRPATDKLIRIFNVASGGYAPDIPVRWGWSFFGRRHITALRWSPDGYEHRVHRQQAAHSRRRDILRRPRRQDLAASLPHRPRRLGLGPLGKRRVNLQQIAVGVTEMGGADAPLRAILRRRDKGDAFGAEFLVSLINIFYGKAQRGGILTVGNGRLVLGGHNLGHVAAHEQGQRGSAGLKLRVDVVFRGQRRREAHHVPIKPERLGEILRQQPRVSVGQHCFLLRKANLCLPVCYCSMRMRSCQGQLLRLEQTVGAFIQQRRSKLLISSPCCPSKIF